MKLFQCENDFRAPIITFACFSVILTRFRHFLATLRGDFTRKTAIPE